MYDFTLLYIINANEPKTPTLLPPIAKNNDTLFNKAPITIPDTNT